MLVTRETACGAVDDDANTPGQGIDLLGSGSLREHEFKANC